MEGATVHKQIKDFDNNANKQKACIAAIQKAYATANSAATVANSNASPQYLVSFKCYLR